MSNRRFSLRRAVRTPAYVPNGGIEYPMATFGANLYAWYKCEPGGYVESGGRATSLLDFSGYDHTLVPNTPYDTSTGVELEAFPAGNGALSFKTDKTQNLKCTTLNTTAPTNASGFAYFFVYRLNNSVTQGSNFYFSTGVSGGSQTGPWGRKAGTANIDFAARITTWRATLDFTGQPDIATAVVGCYVAGNTSRSIWDSDKRKATNVNTDLVVSANVLNLFGDPGTAAVNWAGYTPEFGFINRAISDAEAEGLVDYINAKYGF